jgi:transposase
MGRRTRRLWTDDEKRSICLQTAVAGVSVAQVARRYALNSNLIFKWLHDPRFAPGPEALETAEAERAQFLPVEIIDESKACRDEDWPSSNGSARGRHDGLLEIDLASGHRLRVTGAYDAEALAVLIRRLS